MPTLKEALSRANPTSLPNALQQIALGDVLGGQIPQVLRQQTPDGGNTEQLGTLEAIVLPDSACCASIIRAQCRAGTGAGELVVDAYGTTPASTHIAPAPNGDIVLLTADANEGVDVLYNPERGEVVELTQDCGTDSVLHIPAALVARGVILLREAEALDAAVGKTGKKIIIVPGSAPATLKANLDLAKSLVQFNDATDAVTRARVRLLVKPATSDLADNLAAESPLI